MRGHSQEVVDTSVSQGVDPLLEYRSLCVGKWWDDRLDTKGLQLRLQPWESAASLLLPTMAVGYLGIKISARSGGIKIGLL